ncbi:uncharacterized protein LOC141592526 isoform X2 [Silene latifolia]
MVLLVLVFIPSWLVLGAYLISSFNLCGYITQLGFKSWKRVVLHYLHHQPKPLSLILSLMHFYTFSRPAKLHQRFILKLTIKEISPCIAIAHLIPDCTPFLLKLEMMGNCSLTRQGVREMPAVLNLNFILP